MRAKTDANTRISPNAHKAMLLARIHLDIDHKTLLDEAVGLFLEEHGELLPYLPDELKVALLSPNYANAERPRK